ncbi:glutathione hydrolase 1 proenzyme-like [Rhopilema esculentum]|uniref:glutathione hydrolase 1 proenzyme-like n=1 Tax=Rhopilema esculentum TaxID=499914 RepID=UPI0031D7A64F|eukprot:gene15622-6905_t
MEKGRMKLYAAFLAVLIAVAVIVGVSVHYGTKANNDSAEKGKVVNPSPKPQSTAKPTPSRPPNAAKVFAKAAVATDHELCSNIGKDILKQHGSAVDSLIASLICVGAVNLHSTGIGGGGFMVVYNRKEKKAETFDYRETGPATMTVDIFNADPNLGKVGGNAVGVPGEIRGLRAAFNKYGQLPWRKLFQPTIDLCRKGFPIGKALYENMKKYRTTIQKDPGLRELLFQADGTTLLAEGSILKRVKLANTLEKLSLMPDDMYSGDVGKQFITDVRNAGGIMSMEDLIGYKVLEKQPLVNKLGKLTHYTLPAPNGGPVLTHILNMNSGYNFTSADTSTIERSILTYHRIVESFKFSYAYRPYLGDPDHQTNATEFMMNYNKVISKAQAELDRQRIDDSKTHNTSYYADFFAKAEGYGTTHVSVLAENGDAAAATDTINFAFGAKFRSLTSGIIFNNELADFFTNASYSGYSWPKANAPGPGKRPLSSTCPSIIVDENGDVVMVVGASGGTRITLSTAWVIMKTLWFGMELGAAVVDGRPQHALFPEYIRNEKKNPMDPAIIDGLRKKGHVVLTSSLFAVVQAIYKSKDGLVYAKSDPRKYGKSAGY